MTTLRTFSNASQFSVTNSTFNTFTVAPTVGPQQENVPTSQSPTGKITSVVESEVYVQLLLPKKKGYPLWKPKSNSSHLPDIIKQHGTQIGDVGILNDDGGFDYFFNVLHPANHPLNEGRVPQDFILLNIDQNAINDNEHEYEPWSHIPSNASHIHKTVLASDNHLVYVSVILNLYQVLLTRKLF
ncbi:hypothetical protein F5877DRAFT_53296 [Lentinula edodes]|nr:hypothetical protein F5877DRAFT_53296 [Lentinula edodes]